jgi:cyclin H
MLTLFWHVSRLTCLFLSTKTENHTITIDNFTSKIPKCTNSDVLSLEFLVAQSLKFQFKVHHADLAGRGMMLDMQVRRSYSIDLGTRIEGLSIDIA